MRYFLFALKLYIGFWFITIPITIVMAVTYISDSGYDCGSVEYRLQEASRCFVSPHMWERWGEIADSRPSGGGRRGPEECTKYIEESFYYGFDDIELEALGQWLKNQRGSVETYWSRIQKEDFCSDERTKIWVNQLNKDRK
ncbi:hypothetical protein [Fodinicurvata sediminis]|uniref:hypothetical protein n=1 Tax=Fodinicurvata sediminis TaxID=1121832 RepID=UPI0012DFBF66|nr:hypothetical protein [Fodinicurvata sediminis]